ncbi:hypothetical protein Taro_013548 [Colocasia esculenta]|uniref:Secreted protein n=1 Tax=Colocasia esculenta TaxID=4460 RepID=A0A843UMG2_COLES|nr:hypothetical protein [Colocasia esculenta]
MNKKTTCVTSLLPPLGQLLSVAQPAETCPDSPESEPHQDNNQQFWKNRTRTQGNQAMHLNLKNIAAKQCTSTQRATRQQPETSTTQFWGNLTSTRTNREELQEHLTRVRN